MTRPTSFTERFSQARAAAGVSMAELAKRARLSRTHLYQAQRGVKKLSPAAMLLVAEALGCSERWLETGDGEPPGAFRSSPIGTSLVQKFISLPRLKRTTALIDVLVDLAPELEERAGLTPWEVEQALDGARSELQRRRTSTKAKRTPRYDNVYREGVEWLDSLAGPSPLPTTCNACGQPVEQCTCPVNPEAVEL